MSGQTKLWLASGLAFALGVMFFVVEQKGFASAEAAAWAQAFGVVGAIGGSFAASNQQIVESRRREIAEQQTRERNTRWAARRAAALGCRRLNLACAVLAYKNEPPNVASLMLMRGSLRNELRLMQLIDVGGLPDVESMALFQSITGLLSSGVETFDVTLEALLSTQTRLDPDEVLATLRPNLERARASADENFNELEAKLAALDGADDTQWAVDAAEIRAKRPEASSG